MIMERVTLLSLEQCPIHVLSFPVDKGSSMIWLRPVWYFMCIGLPSLRSEPEW